MMSHLEEGDEAQETETAAVVMAVAAEKEVV